MIPRFTINPTGQLRRINLMDALNTVAPMRHGPIPGVSYNPANVEKRKKQKKKRR